MTKKLFSIALILLILVAGLFLPDAVSYLADWRIETDPVYTVFSPEAEFSYIGTFEDRLRALTSYENMSFDYELADETEWETGISLPAGADQLFPGLGEGETRFRTITLRHKTVSAAFLFNETELHTDAGSVRIVQDAETGKILRLSVINAQNAMKNWENTTEYSVEGFSQVTGVDAYALLRTYARLLGYSDITDLTDGNSYGGSVSTVKADIKGAPFGLSVTFSSDAGMIYYRIMQADGK